MTAPTHKPKRTPAKRRRARTVGDVCPCIVAEQPKCGVNCWHFYRGGECRLCKNTGRVRTPEAVK